jgi:hypothetical protein
MVRLNISMSFRWPLSGCPAPSAGEGTLRLKADADATLSWCAWSRLRTGCCCTRSTSSRRTWWRSACSTGPRPSATRSSRRWSSPSWTSESSRTRRFQLPLSGINCARCGTVGAKRVDPKLADPVAIIIVTLSAPRASGVVPLTACCPWPVRQVVAASGDGARPVRQLCGAEDPGHRRRSPAGGGEFCRFL